MEEKKPFQINDRVGTAVRYKGGKYLKDVVHLQYNEYEDNVIYGSVIDLTVSGKVIVEWDEKSHGGNDRDTLDPSSLLPEEDLQKKLLSLEVEFKKVSDEVSAKMKVAAGALKEANEIATKNNRVLSNMYDAVSPFIREMDRCGWSTSSLNC